MPLVRITLDEALARAAARREAGVVITPVRDEDIDYSDIPAMTEEDWANAVWLAPFEATPEARTPVTLRLKPDVAAWFRAQGQGHTTRMAQVLERYVAICKAREARAAATAGD
jgi:uncharacterized protein (DUF4415 family)